MKTLILSAVLLLLAAVSLTLGVADISLLDAARDAWAGEQSAARSIAFDVRLPRTLLALIVGAGLGMAGAAMQGLLRNPLAEPGVLGVSSGAALGAVITLYFGLAAWGWGVLPVAAMLGSLIALLAIYGLAGKSKSLLVLILAGVALNALFGALTAVALNFAKNLFALQEIIFWLMGSLANRSNDHLLVAAPTIAMGMLLMWHRRAYLDALTLGDDTASSLGFNGNRERILILLGIALAVGGGVAVSGAIGFIGLMVPHLLRRWADYQPGKLLMLSALGGALLLLGADLLVRHLDLVRELKLGVVTSLLGAPFFIYLLMKSKRQFL
ncbi:FecCD family ABC transporter permease [Simiduia agarivorans]|uniref:Hemin transport system permease HmuU n=1 Tax=Simiduia agarivorans (strain DSM 21679 / JCM 13881 / BCRC 17597 / SA1) TaxID=1117647 RepID=K4KLV8_SIMAS|nr:iron ABC transporter permease [Simiduia agarivorans]AFV00027.1 hemin transport system permease HmuU [Simiduia agarivorans SA1 = DSM 21679]